MTVRNSIYEVSEFISMIVFLGGKYCTWPLWAYSTRLYFYVVSLCVYSTSNSYVVGEWVYSAWLNSYVVSMWVYSVWLCFYMASGGFRAEFCHNSRRGWKHDWTEVRACFILFIHVWPSPRPAPPPNLPPSDHTSSQSVEIIPQLVYLV
jgi:hypothetical protein